MKFIQLLLLTTAVVVGWSDIAVAQRWRRSNCSTRPVVTASATHNPISANGSAQVQSSVAGRTEELQRLYDERVEIAREQFKLEVAIFQRGLDSVDRGGLPVALAQLLKAEYEAATTAHARLDALKRNVENAQLFHDLAQHKFSLGLSNGTNSSRARYLLITAKISLAEEERKVAAKAER